MARILSTLILLICLGMSAWAVPAKPGFFTVSQPDGTEVSVSLIGDEHSHCYVSTDGVPLVMTDTYSMEYACLDNDYLTASGILAHNPETRAECELKYVQDNKSSLNDGMLRHLRAGRAHTEHFEPRTPRILSRGSDYIGRELKALVILVQFPDLPMYGDAPQAKFNDAFNKHGYNEDGHYGSVADYFYDQSFGKLKIRFDVVGPFTLEHELAYYGENDRNGSDKRAYEAIAEGVRMADPQVDFADYDWDGDNEVEQVFVIYAGYAEAQGAPENTIWPHKWCLSSAFDEDELPFVCDGVTVDTYACSSELSGKRGYKYDGIGTACHEFSHCLGLPDIYDTGYNGGFGMEHLDVMGSGSYSGPQHCGEVPCGFSAYERWYLGWMDLTELTETTQITDMPALNDGPVGYIYYNPFNHNEYLIYENRQNRDWFSYVNTSTKCHGLLVTHVDYSAGHWRTNKVNNFPQHERIAPIVADGDLGYCFTRDGVTVYNPSDEDYEGDFFPGSKNVTALTNDSHENVWGKWYTPDDKGSRKLGAPLTGIRESGGLISFDFKGGRTVASPCLVDVRCTGTDELTIEWTHVDEAETYIVEIKEARQLPMDHIVLNENFLKFKNSETKEGANISKWINLYTKQTGWTAKNVYTSAHGPILGNGNVTGYLLTPLFDVTSEGITVKLQVSATEDAEILLDLNDLEGNTLYTKCLQYEASTKAKTYVVNIDGIDAWKTYTLKLSSKSRPCIEGIIIYDYHFTSEQVNVSIFDQVSRPIETFTVEDLTDCRYTIAGLKGRKYTIRVRAEVATYLSEWSDPLLIDLDEGVGIKDTSADSDAPIHIYTIYGVEVRDMVLPGIYILDYGNRSTKVIK